MKKDKVDRSFRDFVKKLMGPDFRITDLTKHVENSSDNGMRKTFRRDPRRLEALILGYKALHEQDRQRAEQAGD